MEQTMRFLKTAAILGTLAAGVLGLPTLAAASPLVSGAAPMAGAVPGSVVKAQYYYPGRPVMRPYPVYRPRPVVRYRPVYRPYPVYRPVRVPPRVVCRTTLRVVNINGYLQRRPVQRCVRRY